MAPEGKGQDKMETNQTFCFEGTFHNCQIKKYQGLDYKS